MRRTRSFRSGKPQPQLLDHRREIAIVMQETSLAPDLSVLENIFLPELGRKGLLSYGSMRRAEAA